MKLYSLNQDEIDRGMLTNVYICVSDYHNKCKSYPKDQKISKLNFI